MSVPLPGWFSAMQERADRRPARRRHPRPADRHPLRRPAPERRLRTDFGEPRATCATQAEQDGVSPEARRRRAADPRPPRLPGRGRARHVPLPLVLRARRHPAASVLDDIRDFLVANPRRGPGDHQPGLRDPAGLRRRGATRPASARSPTRGPTDERVADAAGDDRQRPARRVPGREPRGGAPWYQLAYERHHRGDAVRLLRRRPQLTDPAKLPASCRPTAGRRRSAVPPQPLDHAPTRCRGRPTPRRSTPSRRCCRARASASGCAAASRA